MTVAISIIGTVLVIAIAVAYKAFELSIKDRAAARREDGDTATRLLVEIDRLRDDTAKLNEKFAANTARNDAALTNFLKQVHEIVAETSKAKIAAEQKVVSNAYGNAGKR